jgi:small-conductance mechanosensitive channel
MPTEFLSALLPTATASGVPDAGSRFGLTLLTLLVALLVSRGLQRWFSTSHAAPGHEARRRALVASRNLLYVVTIVVLASLWLVQLRHLALSVAAIATGLLLSGRELVLGLLGRLLLAATRPFGIGDVVEVGTYSGRVIDLGLFTTTLLETDAARQYTGHTVELPNAMLVTLGVRNLSHTGRYVIESLRVPVAVEGDVGAERDRLLACTQRACAPHLEDAVRWLARVEADEVLRLPDSEPRVLVEPRDAFQVDLVARFPAPAERRAYVAQAVLQEYYAGADRRVPARAAVAAQVLSIGRAHGG